jgi:hypothetical protein
VEWTGPSPDHAVKICWRNWGRQIRVLPAPNIAAPRFRDASRRELWRFVGRSRSWADQLPPNKRHLFAGVKVGWEASIGVNAYHYPDGNRYLEQFPDDPSRDPRHGYDTKKDFSGGLAPLGYAALASKGWRHNGPVTLADHERLSRDYLAFLAAVCRDAGLRRDQVFVHAGGQYAPWPLHYSHRTALVPDATPGWSLYNLSPDRAGDLAAVLEQARRADWCAAEWLTFVQTADGWTDALEQTLRFKNCRFVSIYNWESIFNKPEALQGIRRALAAAAPPPKSG